MFDHRGIDQRTKTCLITGFDLKGARRSKDSVAFCEQYTTELAGASLNSNCSRLDTPVPDEPG